MARSASTTAYAATMAELATYANGAYTPNYYTGTPSMDGTGAAGTAAFVSRGDHVHPSDTSRVAKAGDTMAGFLTLNANPTANLHAATKQYVDGSAPVGGPYVAIANMHDTGRNLVHNPLYNVGQRGAGPWSISGYTLDRWQVGVVTDTVSFSRSALTDGHRAAIGDEAAAYGLTNVFTGNAAAGAFNLIFQPIEDVRRLAGKTVTVSFWAVASGALKLGVAIDQNFGTGGSPSASVNGAGVAVTLSTTFARYSVTFAVPSVSGKTLGTSGGDNTQLDFWFSSGTTMATRAGNVGVQSGSMNIWGVQLEIGSVATPLEKPDPRYDLANCMRFYQVGQLSCAGWAGGASQQILWTALLSTQMRATPAVVAASAAATNCGSFSAATYNPSSIVLAAVATAIGYYLASATFTASADL